MKATISKGLIWPELSQLHQVSQHGDYTVSVDKRRFASYGAYLHHKGECVGEVTTGGRLTGANRKKYLKVKWAGVHKEHMGQGHGTRLYQTLLSHLPDGYAGIGNKVEDQWNDEQVPRIWNRLGARHEVSARKNQMLIDKPKPVKPVVPNPAVVKSLPLVVIVIRGRLLKAIRLDRSGNSRLCVIMRL